MIARPLTRQHRLLLAKNRIENVWSVMKSNYNLDLSQQGKERYQYVQILLLQHLRLLVPQS